MAQFLKLLLFMVVGYIVLTNIGKVVETFDHGRPVARPVHNRPAMAPERSVVRLDGPYAQACSRFDPVAHPEQVLDVLRYASRVTSTPLDILYAVWSKETNQLDGAGKASGKCGVVAELTRRDAAKGTHHLASMRAMAQRFGWDLDNMTCSCPKIDDETGDSVGFGGSCTPFQLSGEEIDDEYALPLNLDPMRLCGSALIAGWTLKKHHDDALKPRKMRGGGMKPSRAEAFMAEYGYRDLEQAAWHAALGRYAGDTDGDNQSRAFARWREFSAWRAIDQRQPGYLLAKILEHPATRRSLKYHRTRRAR